MQIFLYSVLALPMKFMPQFTVKLLKVFVEHPDHILMAAMLANAAFLHAEQTNFASAAFIACNSAY